MNDYLLRLQRAACMTDEFKRIVEEISKMSLLQGLKAARQLHAEVLSSETHWQVLPGGKRATHPHMPKYCRTLRKKLGLRQREMAEALEMSLPLYRLLEQGQKTWVKREQMFKLRDLELLNKNDLTGPCSPCRVRPQRAYADSILRVILWLHPEVDRLASLIADQKTQGNDLAPSVAEADAILAKFGYAERELAAA